MKQRMFITILAVLAVLAGNVVKVYAREAQPGDDRGVSMHRFSSHFMIKNGLQLIDDRGNSARGADDLPGDDRGLSSRGADDLAGDDRSIFRHGVDDLPGDDRGGSTQLSGELELGDDKGGLTQNPPASSSASSQPQLVDDKGGNTQPSPIITPVSTQPQPIDDHGGHGGGSDDPSGHK